MLPDYNDMEIKMEPIVKAVYLLFLKHPEGIAFKCLPDYRQELAEIYTKLRPMGRDKSVAELYQREMCQNTCCFLGRV